MIGQLNTLGWLLSNNEQNNIVIQRDDEMNAFKNDDEATEFLVVSYRKLLNASNDFIRAKEFAEKDKCYALNQGIHQIAINILNTSIIV